MGEGTNDDPTDWIEERLQRWQYRAERDFPVSRKELPGKGYRVVHFPDKWR